MSEPTGEEMKAAGWQWHAQMWFWYRGRDVIGIVGEKWQRRVVGRDDKGRKVVTWAEHATLAEAVAAAEACR